MLRQEGRKPIGRWRLMLHDNESLIKTSGTSTSSRAELHPDSAPRQPQPTDDQVPIPCLFIRPSCEMTEKRSAQNKSPFLCLFFFETGLTQLLESNRVTNANIKGRGCRLYRENRKVTQDLRAKHKPFLCLLKVFF